jgi:two-component system cell cycle sensor histidine kinase/response regulator CckA
MQVQKPSQNGVRRAAQPAGFTAPEPIIDQNPRRSGAGRLLALGGVLIAAGTAFVVLRDRIGDQSLLFALGVFAMIGIFYLFASVIGFIQISPKTASDSLSKAFLDSQPQGVVIVDKRDRIVYANRAYAEITGAASATDVRSIGALFGSDAEANSVIYRMSQLAGEGAGAEHEIRVDRALSRRAGNGQPAWYRLRARVLTTENLMRKFFVWQIVDITGERLDQERYFLQVQEAINHLDLAPAGFLATDALHNITYINASLAGWLGLDLASFAPGKMNLLDLVAGDGMTLIRAAQARDSNRNAVFDLDLLKPNGSALPVRFLHARHRGPNGQPAGTRTIVLNRAEGDESTDAVRNAEVRFTRFFNSTPMAIAAIDRAGALVRMNTPFVALFGDGRGEGGQPRTLSAHVHPRDAGQLAKAVQAAFAGQADIAPIDTVFAKDEERHLRIFVHAVVGTSVAGAEPGDEAAIIHLLETTEQKALEAQMAQGQKMQAVGQLAGGIAHDFNNVLSAIIMSSDLLLQNQRPSDPSFTDIMSIKQNANRAASLVRQLLAFSRRQTLRPETLDFTDVLADIRMLLSRLVGNAVDLKIEHGRDLWPVRADLGQLEQVLTNLCINARDAMPTGGAITIATRNVPASEINAFGRKEMPEADHVLVSVRDSGTGIAPEHIKKIFEPFFTTKDVGKGTGLGLSMVYGIIKQSGGFIYVESEVGKGTEFQILLPRLIEEKSEANAAEAAAAPGGDGGAARGAAQPENRDLSGQGTILLVEDEDAVRMGGVRALKSRGYTVIEASTGVEALDAFRQANGTIDLIVSDVVMPEMDGPTLLGEVRKLQPGIKFIFVSGYAEDAFAKNLPADAQFGFLPKPFSLKQLATTVKEWMEKPQ